MKYCLLIFFITSYLVLNLLPSHPKHIVSQENPINYGSLGLLLATTKQKTKKYRVGFLGNSVLQTCLQNLISKEFQNNRDDIEIINFSSMGASIADYLVLYEFLKDLGIDFLVVHFSNFTISGDPPIFKTNVKDFYFHPQLKELRKFSTFTNEFSTEEIAKSLVLQPFPVLQQMSLNKALFRNKINTYTKSLINIKLMDIFPFKTGLHDNWEMNNSFQAFSKKIKKHTYGNNEKAYILYMHFIDQLLRKNQRTIFVKQESSEIDDYSYDNIISHMKRLSKKPQFSFYDFTNFYKPDFYEDSIHPKKTEAPIVAKRLFNAITRHIPQ